MHLSAIHLIFCSYFSHSNVDDDTNGVFTSHSFESTLFVWPEPGEMFIVEYFIRWSVCNVCLLLLRLLFSHSLMNMRVMSSLFICNRTIVRRRRPLHGRPPHTERYRCAKHQRMVMEKNLAWNGFARWLEVRYLLASTMHKWTAKNMAGGASVKAHDDLEIATRRRSTNSMNYEFTRRLHVHITSIREPRSKWEMRTKERKHRSISIRSNHWFQLSYHFRRQFSSLMCLRRSRRRRHLNWISRREIPPFAYSAIYVHLVGRSFVHVARHLRFTIWKSGVGYAPAPEMKCCRWLCLLIKPRTTLSVPGRLSQRHTHTHALRFVAGPTSFSDRFGTFSLKFKIHLITS